MISTTLKELLTATDMRAGFPLVKQADEALASKDDAQQIEAMRALYKATAYSVGFQLTCKVLDVIN